jgi:predicted phosphodiesterase
MSKARVAAISCTHVPYESKGTIDKLLNRLSELDSEKPLTHFVHLGDLMDATAASVHSDDPVQHTLLDEYNCAADLLKKIRSVLNPDCKFVWCHGNHDDNILRQDPRRIPHDIRPLCNWNNVAGCGDEFRLWKQIPYRMGKEGCYQLGAIIFAHGWACGQNSDELEGLKLAMACGGWSHRLTVRGHTHRPVPPTQSRRSATITLPWHYANVGHCAFDDRASYTYRFDVSRWARSFLIGECATGRPDRLGANSWDAAIEYL